MQIKHNVSFSLVATLLAAVPEWIFSHLNDNYIAVTNIKTYLIFFFLLLCCSFLKSTRVFISVLAGLAMLQSSQLMYFHYFGNFSSAFDLNLLFIDTYDALIGFWDVAPFLLLPGLLPFVAVLALALLKQQWHSKLRLSRAAPYSLSLLLCLPFVQSFGSNAFQKFQPNVGHSALKNGLYSISYFASLKLRGVESANHNYVPYNVLPAEASGYNIVVIMGESLSRYNMSLYGYERDTTPNLVKLSSSPNFFFTKAVSSAVTTRVSLAMFYNVLHEPNNPEQLRTMDSALYRLAKNNGYDTHYITTQKNAGALTHSFSMADVDTWQDNDELSRFEGDFDNRLLLALDELALKNRPNQFITLHMRSSHAPYVDNYPDEFELFPTSNQPYEHYMRNSYDNSVRYSDEVIADILMYFKDSDVPTLILMTSDHGELLGQDGRYGHNQVDLDVAAVPFLFLGVKIPDEELDHLKEVFGCITNHHEMSTVIAGLLGEKVSNPNQILGEYFLNGQSPYGEAGFKRYRLDKASCSATLLE